MRTFQCIDFYAFFKRPIAFYFLLFFVLLLLLLFVLSFIVNMELEDRKCLSVYEGSPERDSCLGELRVFSLQDGFVWL